MHCMLAMRPNNNNKIVKKNTCTKKRAMRRWRYATGLYE